MKHLFLVCTLSLTLHATHKLPQQDLYNLEIFNTGQEPSIFSALDRTLTDYGHEALKTQCAQYETSIEALEKQQKAIFDIINSPELHQKLQECLATFAEHENALAQCTIPASSTSKALYEDLYFKQPFFTRFNSSPNALLLGQMAPLMGLTFATLEHFIIHWYLHGNGHHDHNHKKDTHKKHNHECCHEEHSHSLSALFKNIPSPVKYTLDIAHWGMHAAIMLHTLHETVQKMELCKKLQSDLMHIAQVLEVARELCDIAADNAHLNAYCTQLVQCKDIVEGQAGSDQCKELIALLQSSTFQEAPSLFSHSGKILRAHHLFQEVKDELKAALSFVGQLDLLSCLATVLTIGDTNGNRYTFATYVSQSTPYLNIVYAVHPLAPTDNSPHTMSLSHPEFASIITGDNGSGKSMLLKLIGVTAWMAQSLTIVPAKNVFLTPFSDIITAMQIHDATQQGMSYFMNEVAAAQQCLARIETAKSHNGFALCLVDELFKGTNHDKSYATLLEFFDDLLANPHCLSLTTTHHEKLAQQFENDPKVKTLCMIVNRSGQTSYCLQSGIFSTSNE